MPQDPASDWYLMDGGIVEGPMSELEMRRRLRKSSSKTLQVKQGTSGWHHGEAVRRKIQALQSHGIYIRSAKMRVGPFTLTKACELLNAMNDTGIEIRTGADGEWVSAEHWLNTLHELRSRGNHDAQSVSLGQQQSIEGAGPTGRPNALPPATPSLPSVLPSRDVVLQPRPRNPRTQKSQGRPRKRSPNRLLLALAGSLLAAIVVLGFVLLTRSQGDTEGLQTNATAIPYPDRGVPSPAADDASLVNTSTDRATTVAPDMARPGAEPIGPPTLSGGTLFRPQFTTRDGVIDAGTAFAAKIEGASGVFIISALHLFGEAGGLDADIPSEQLPAAWSGLTLEDCSNHNWFGEVKIRPVLLTDAKPLPAPSVFGDVAACVVTDETGFTPLPLGTKDPQPGERVWMLANVIGSPSTRHAATIYGFEDGWLLYEFEQTHIELRATSGAPIVDQSGRVVAVNAGGGEQQGVTIGVGTPVTKFVGALRHQLQP